MTQVFAARLLSLAGLPAPLWPGQEQYVADLGSMASFLALQLVGESTGKPVPRHPSIRGGRELLAGGCLFSAMTSIDLSTTATQQGMAGEGGSSYETDGGRFLLQCCILAERDVRVSLPWLLVTADAAAFAFAGPHSPFRSYGADAVTLRPIVKQQDSRGRVHSQGAAAAKLSEVIILESIQPPS